MVHSLPARIEVLSCYDKPGHRKRCIHAPCTMRDVPLLPSQALNNSLLFTGAVNPPGRRDGQSGAL